MRLARDAVRTVMLALTAGLAIGGAAGVLAPAFAEAGPGPATPGATAHAAPALVTSVDLLGSDRLEVTVRFTNSGRAVEHIDDADLGVTADGAVLRARSTDSLDVHPGGSAEETLTFDAPPPGAALTLRLPDGSTLPLG